MAIPDELVSTDPPVTEPPPLVTTKLTVTPAIGSAFSSVTRTDGAGVMTLLARPESDVLLVATIAVGIGGSTPLPPSHAMPASTTAAAVDLTATETDFVMKPTSGPDVCRLLNAARSQQVDVVNTQNRGLLRDPVFLTGSAGADGIAIASLNDDHPA